MSRAFVDELASAGREEDVPERKIPLPPGAKNYMTPDGAERLRGELSHLLAAERPRLVAEIAVADKGALSSLQPEIRVGDAARRLAEADRRIEYLRRMAAILEVIDPRQQKGDRIVFGATVTVLEDDQAERVYRIVGVDESDPGRGWVSWVSPVARSMVGKKVGDRVPVKLPVGEKTLEILRIEYL
jgi:transcription elongation factor GreB